MNEKIEDFKMDSPLAPTEQVLPWETKENPPKEEGQDKHANDHLSL